MTKQELNAAVQAAKEEARAALQLLYDEIVPGQQKQVVKNPEVKAMLDRFGVEYGG